MVTPKASKKKVAKKSLKLAEHSAGNFEQQDLETTNLDLDPNNPRLPPELQGKSEKTILQAMIQRFAIDELAESICSTGFQPLDPFVGYKSGEKVVILEGNRRLATLKLLLSPELVPKAYDAKWSDFRDRLTPESLRQMSRIRVCVYPTRVDANLLAYIGFRHVNGVLSWEAEEKAAFIASLIESPNVEWDYATVASRIGSKPSYVEKLYVAHRLIEQAKSNDVPGYKRMRGQFGVLTRALQSPGITKFLEIDFPKSPRKSLEPAKCSSQNLADFVSWTFGTEDTEPILNDSRDLTKWGTILNSKDSVNYMRTNRAPRFDRAYSKSGGAVENLVSNLMAASDSLEEAIPHLRRNKHEREVVQSVEKLLEYLIQVAEQFKEIARRTGIRIDE